MFERFPAESVRALFIARAAALNTARQLIEIEHLVAGAVSSLADISGESTTAQRSLAILQDLGLETAVASVSGELAEIPFSRGVQRLLNHAVEVADRLGHHRIRPEHLLLAVFEEGAATPAQALERAGLGPEALAEAATRQAAIDDTALPHSARGRLTIKRIADN